jgi:hypothetical protein
MVEVYHARTEMEAQVIKGLLESFNIPCIFRSNAAPSVHMMTMDGMGEVRVLVLESQAEEARGLINTDQENSDDNEVPEK